MNETAYLAFDLGASSGRAILGVLRDGRLHMEELHRFPTPIVEHGDRLYWDLDAVWEDLRTGLRRALQAAPALRSLSVNSWGVDYVPLDADGRPVRRAYCYRDPRTNEAMEKVFARVPRKAIYAATGIQFMPINTLYQLFADREQEPALLHRTHLRLMIADYFNHRFGGRAVAEVSLASTAQMMDVHRQTWAVPLLERLGLPATGWPEIVPSGTHLGHAAEAPGVAVIASCSHDTACAVAAVPAEMERSWAYVSCGTWSLFGVERAEPLLSEAALHAGFTNEAGVDGTLRFLTNLTGLWVLQECERAWREAGETYTYDALMAEAEAAPAHQLQIDLDDPRFAARGDMLARLRVYCEEKEFAFPDSRGRLVRSLLESLAQGYSLTLRELESVIGEPIDVLHLVGGGSQNALLCQWTADACGRTVVAGPAEATAMGNLLIQARTLGDLPQGHSIRDVVRSSSTLSHYQPNAAS